MLFSLGTDTQLHILCETGISVYICTVVFWSITDGISKKKYVGVYIFIRGNMRDRGQLTVAKPLTADSGPLT
jgi:hypothetical protein